MNNRKPRNLAAYIATCTSREGARRVADRMTREGNGLYHIGRVDGTWAAGTTKDFGALSRRGCAVELGL